MEKSVGGGIKKARSGWVGSLKEKREMQVESSKEGSGKGLGLGLGTEKDLLKIWNCVEKTERAGFEAVRILKP